MERPKLVDIEDLALDAKEEALDAIDLVKDLAIGGLRFVKDRLIGGAWSEFGDSSEPVKANITYFPEEEAA